MEKDKENNRHKEEWFINDLLKNNTTLYKAPEGFTNKFMQSIHPVGELSQELKKPLLDIKGKIVGVGIFAILFVIGLSIGYELTSIPGISSFMENVKYIFRIDYAVMTTMFLSALAILLFFNEFLKKIFARR
jgi:hypothetical protein